MKILETDRIILQQLNENDASFIYKLVNNPTWIKFIGDKKIHSLEDARNYILNGPMQSYKRFGFGLYLMKLKSDNTPIGICGLIKRDTLEDVDIGFALLPEYAGNGYTSEAVSAIMVYAVNFLKLSRIVAITQPDNNNCIKLLTNSGFTFENNIKSPDDIELMLFGIKL
jgi:RimJ/RimL family protein N-acetyltransferase